MPAPGNEAADRRRAIEALAQLLYEASDPVGIPWSRRRSIIREPWLRLAERHIEQGEPPPAPDGTAQRRDLCAKE